MTGGIIADALLLRRHITGVRSAFVTCDVIAGTMLTEHMKRCAGAVAAETLRGATSRLIRTGAAAVKAMTVNIEHFLYDSYVLLLYRSLQLINFVRKVEYR